MIRQRTLRKPVQVMGVGLQSGRRVRLTLHPAAVDSGIMFRRIDLPGAPEVGAGRGNLLDDAVSTTLARDGAVVSGVEHLLAAFSGLGIDNVRVDLDAPEVPVLDGGAGLFVYLIQSAGIAQQRAAKRFIRILQKVAVEEGGRRAVLEPFDGFKVTLGIDFESSDGVAETRFAGIDFATASFARELQRLRELPASGHLHAAEAGRDPAPGGGGEDYVEQMLRHRVLNVIADLYLLGRSMIGAFSGHGVGHALNIRLLGELSAQPSAWEEIVFEQESLNPISYVSPVREI